MTSKQNKKQEPLSQSRVKKSIKISFAHDYLKTSQRLMSERDSFASAHKIFSTCGNVALYIGTGISTASSGLQLFNQGSLSNIFLFTSTGFFAVSIVLIGIAKFTINRADQRIAQLDSYKADVGFTMRDEVTDDKSKPTNPKSLRTKYDSRPRGDTK